MGNGVGPTFFFAYFWEMPAGYSYMSTRLNTSFFTCFGCPVQIRAVIETENTKAVTMWEVSVFFWLWFLPFPLVGGKGK